MARDEQPPIEAEIVDGASTSSSSLEAMDALTRSEIDMQIATARRFPRDIVKAKKAITELATLDEETAESCFYSLKRKSKEGEKIIQGPSIRLAEIALSCFKNLRAGTRILGETPDGKFIRVLGVCQDLENNVTIAREIARRITTSTGRKFGDDMIGVTAAAAGAIALRNAVVTVVPRALIMPAFRAARDVAVGATKSLTEMRQKVVDRLRKLSPAITLEKILLAVERKSIDEITAEDVTHLIGLGTAIKDGMQTVEEAFPDPAAEASVLVSEILGDPAPEAAGEVVAEVKPQAESPAETNPQGPLSGAPPWPVITTAEANALRARLSKIGIEVETLMETIVGDSGLALEHLHAAKYSAADEAIKKVEAKKK